MSKLNGKKVSKVNQLHDMVDWNLDNLVFADPVYTEMNDGDTPIKFHRINLLTKNHELDENGNTVFDENGLAKTTETMGDVNFLWDRSFSFGVSENKSKETGKVTGHSMSLCLWSKEGVTEREIKVTDKLTEFIEKCKAHLLTVKKELKKPKLEESDLKKMGNLLYWKVDEEGERIPGIGPTISPKLVEFQESKNKKTGIVKPYQMCTIFYLEDEVDEDGNPLEVSPLDYLSDPKNKKYCLMYTRPVLKFESIFFGINICIQCKVTESDIAPIKTGTQRLLHHKHTVSSNKISITKPTNNPLLSVSYNPSKNDEDSDNDEELKKEMELKEPASPSNVKELNDDDEEKPSSPSNNKKAPKVLKKKVKKEKSSE